MAYNVKFLKGTADQYAQLASKDANSFYFTSDDNNLYLGEIKLSNGAELAAAILRIGQNESDIDSIQEQLAQLTAGGSGSIAEMINNAKAEINGKIGNLENLNTTAKADLVGAINEVLAAVGTGGVDAQVTIDSSITTEGMAKSYTIKQGGTTVGTIDIPKDMVVSSATVETNPEGQAAGTYIVLTIANAAEDKIYINVGKLVDIYTAAQGATQVQLSIDQSKNEISASIVAGSITATELAADAITTEKIADANVTKAKLSSEVQASLEKANSAVQSVTEGTADGTISVDGTAVSVHGLKSAAYAEASSFDAAGMAGTAEANAKSYTDAEIQKLDADVSSAAVEAGKGIQVQVVETDGKVTSVAVSGDYSATYDVLGAASTAETNAKTYTDNALTWNSIA